MDFPISTEVILNQRRCLNEIDWSVENDWGPEDEELDDEEDDDFYPDNEL